MKRLLLALVIAAGCYAGLAYAGAATKTSASDFRQVWTGTVTGDGDITVATPTGFEGGGVTADCDGTDGGGTATANYSCDGGTTYRAITNTAGAGVTWTAAEGKTIYQAGFGCAPSNYKITLAGSAANPTLTCKFMFTRPK